MEREFTSRLCNDCLLLSLSNETLFGIAIFLKVRDLISLKNSSMKLKSKMNSAGFWRFYLSRRYSLDIPEEDDGKKRERSSSFESTTFDNKYTKKTRKKKQEKYNAYKLKSHNNTNRFGIRKDETVLLFSGLRENDSSAELYEEPKYSQHFSESSEELSDTFISEYRDAGWDEIKPYVEQAKGLESKVTLCIRSISIGDLEKRYCDAVTRYQDANQTDEYTKLHLAGIMRRSIVHPLLCNSDTSITLFQLSGLSIPLTSGNETAKVRAVNEEIDRQLELPICKLMIVCSQGSKGIFLNILKSKDLTNNVYDLDDSETIIDKSHLLDVFRTSVYLVTPKLLQSTSSKEYTSSEYRDFSKLLVIRTVLIVEWMDDLDCQRIFARFPDPPKIVKIIVKDSVDEFNNHVTEDFYGHSMAVNRKMNNAKQNLLEVLKSLQHP
jgi:hypothetical protein